MKIIKQNNMTNQHKVIFYIWVWVWVRGGYLYTRYPFHTRVLKSGKTHTHTQTRSKPVKLGLVWVGNHRYGFCCHVYFECVKIGNSSL